MFASRKNPDDGVSVQFSKSNIEWSGEENGIIFDVELTFDKHKTKICHKAANKVSALSGIAKYMGIVNLRYLMKALLSINS